MYAGEVRSPEPFCGTRPPADVKISSVGPITSADPAPHKRYFAIKRTNQPSNVPARSTHGEVHEWNEP
jgi:hypothetical protein